jgi:thiol-disulfide isomerase/thioredoxin
VEVLLVVLAVSTAVGLLHRRRSGRVREVRADDRSAVLAELGERRGSRATLLQFSSAFCAPCRATRRVLGQVAGQLEGVRHVEVDAESHLALVRTLGVLRTPTTLVLDATGAEVFRAVGQPRPDAVLRALGS